MKLTYLLLLCLSLAPRQIQADAVLLADDRSVFNMGFWHDYREPGYTGRDPVSFFGATNPPASPFSVWDGFAAVAISGGFSRADQASSVTGNHFAARGRAEANLGCACGSPIDYYAISGSLYSVRFALDAPHDFTTEFTLARQQPLEPYWPFLFLPPGQPVPLLKYSLSSEHGFNIELFDSLTEWGHLEGSLPAGEYILSAAVQASGSALWGFPSTDPSWADFQFDFILIPEPPGFLLLLLPLLALVLKNPRNGV